MPSKRRPRFALPYTILGDGDTVRLIAGEDFRYSLGGPGLGEWLPRALAAVDGRLSIEELAERVDSSRREAFMMLLDRLESERVLVEAPRELAHAALEHPVAIAGSGPLRDRLAAELGVSGGNEEDSAGKLHVFCQDRLDFEAALEFERGRRASREPWLWATVGPMRRAYVGPLFLPDAGPCLACLLGHFSRLSPMPELYAELREHARWGGVIRPIPVDPALTALAASIAAWKVRLGSDPRPPPPLYRLHAIEAGTLEVSLHRVPRDPECPGCGGAAA